ncbi:MAG: proton-conducting transporter membrane subunit [Cyanobacteriota bacterium]|nr:proton-conducting transporter membrane subunit [Cyanobacteriota bacterium]
MTLTLSPPLLTAWLLLPYLAGFMAALLPRFARLLVLFCCLATALVGASALLAGPQAGVALRLLGSTGVSLSVDVLAGWFVLLAALLIAAVLVACWERVVPGPMALLLLVLLGGLNTAFTATDLISIYVTLEVVGISAFLLILRERSDRSLWVALRYLLVSNTAMTLYLIGAGLVYAQSGSFALGALAQLPLGGAQAFVLLGLLTKAGVFIAGLWLPRTHAEAPAEISALLSGVVVTAGAVPLLRLAAIDPRLLAVLQLVALASALLGVVAALSASDVKRLLAWSTLSQMGLVLLSPLAGGAMAFSHGLAKAALFLLAGRLPSRQLDGWRQRALPLGLQLCLYGASLSIAGVPPLLGFAAKKQLQDALDPPLAAALVVVSVGTVMVYARLWGAPLPTRAGAEAFLSPGVRLAAGSLVLALLLVGLWQWPAAAGAGAEALLSSVAVLGAGVLLQEGLQRLPLAPFTTRALRENLQDLLGNLALLGSGLLLAFRVGVG